MSYILSTYSFNHVTKQITFTNYTAPVLERISVILNVTRGIYMYRADTPVTLGGSFAGNVLTLVLNTNTAGYADTDKLAIGYNDVNAIDNDPLNQVYRPAIGGGKAVDISTYAPAYAAGDSAVMSFNKDNGAQLINQGNLDPAFDGVKSYGVASASSITGLSYARYTSVALPVNTTFQNVKSTPGNVFAYRIINAAASVIYVKFYNKTGAVFTDTPFMTIAVPTGVGSSVVNDYPIGKFFATALSIRCTTGILDADIASPATAPIIEIDYV